MSGNVRPIRNIKSYGDSFVSNKLVQYLENPEIQLYNDWASIYGGLIPGNPYFDYYYSGQDVSIKIEGLGEDLNIYNMGYSVQQQKQPVYGFWDYTYSAMLRGTRIVVGAFSFVVQEPYELNRKIAKAAENRANIIKNKSGNLNHVFGIDEDEANIQRYWRRHMDSNLQMNQNHIFSVHPPFNFLIEYGIQITSASTTTMASRGDEIRALYDGQAPIHSDYNERLVPHVRAEDNHKILLENVELTSKSVEYNVDGDPILETYTFIARDERILIDKIAQTGPVNPNPSSGANGVNGYGSSARFR